MHPYIVTVSDKKKQRLSIPCAEIETAMLVQKNLESLFPDAQVSIKNQSKPTDLSVSGSSLSLVHSVNQAQNIQLPCTKDYEELEEELFEGVA